MPNVVILKIDLQKDFAAGIWSVWGPLPSYDSILPLLHTVHVYIGYNTSIDREGGRGEGRANLREG
jgi:hypothetical protein